LYVWVPPSQQNGPLPPNIHNIICNKTLLLPLNVNRPVINLRGESLHGTMSRHTASCCHQICGNPDTLAVRWLTTCMATDWCKLERV